MTIQKISHRPSRSSDNTGIWSFQVVLQRTVKICTEVYNARAQLLFWPFNLLFGDVLFAVVVVVRLSSPFGSASRKVEVLGKQTVSLGFQSIDSKLKHDVIPVHQKVL